MESPNVHELHETRYTNPCEIDVRYPTRWCRCGIECDIRVAADPKKDSLGTLYYCCRKGKGGCRFWQWCNPDLVQWWPSGELVYPRVGKRTSIVVRDMAKNRVKNQQLEEEAESSWKGGNAMELEEMSAVSQKQVQFEMELKKMKEASNFSRVGWVAFFVLLVVVLIKM